MRAAATVAAVEIGRPEPSTTKNSFTSYDSDCDNSTPVPMSMDEEEEEFLGENKSRVSFSYVKRNPKIPK